MTLTNFSGLKVRGVNTSYINFVDERETSCASAG